jgi:hypothetical protein
MASVAAVIAAASRFKAGISLIYSSSVSHRERRDDDSKDCGESHSGISKVILEI